MYSVPRCIYILQINSAKTRLIAKSFQSVKQGMGLTHERKNFLKILWHCRLIVVASVATLGVQFPHSTNRINRGMCWEREGNPTQPTNRHPDGSVSQFVEERTQMLSLLFNGTVSREQWVISLHTGNLKTFLPIWIKFSLIKLQRFLLPRCEIVFSILFWPHTTVEHGHWHTLTVARWILVRQSA